MAVLIVVAWWFTGFFLSVAACRITSLNGRVTRGDVLVSATLGGLFGPVTLIPAVLGVLFVFALRMDEPVKFLSRDRR